MIYGRIFKLSLMLCVSSLLAFGTFNFFTKINHSSTNSDLETNIDIQQTDSSTTCRPAHLLGLSSLKKQSNQTVLTPTGTIPSWLKGSLIAIGPGIFELEKSTAGYWLDGFAMIHQFNIGLNDVTYSNKIIDSAYYQDCCKKGKLRGSLPEKKKSTWSKLTSALGTSNRPVYDNTNMNIACFNNHLVTLTETPIPLRVDKKSLATKGKFNFDDNLEPHFASAHPLFDANQQEWIGVAIQFAHTSNYIVYKMHANSNKRIPIATIPVGYPSYMHSFALTKNYIILTEAPLVVSPYDLLMTDTSFIDTFTWQPKNGTIFTVIDRHNGKKIGSYKTDSFFTLHHVNAHENNNSIVIDLIAYKNPDIITKAFNYKNLCHHKPHLPAAQLKRFHIDLASKNISSTVLSPHNIELPQINSNYVMRDYCYLYATLSEAGPADKLIKFDLHSKRHIIWHCTDCYTTEPVFVARPGAQIEDDGVVLSVILDCPNQNSFLLILDAKTFTEVARIPVPHHIPFTIHSKFFA